MLDVQPIPALTNYMPDERDQYRDAEFVPAPTTGWYFNKANTVKRDFRPITRDTIAIIHYFRFNSIPNSLINKILSPNLNPQDHKCTYLNNLNHKYQQFGCHPSTSINKDKEFIVEQASLKEEFVRYKDLALNTLNSSLRHLERTGRAAGKQPELRSTTAPRPCREVDRLRAMIDKLSSIKVNKDFRIQDPTAPHTTPATQNNAAPATRPTTTTRAEFVPYYRELEKDLVPLFSAPPG
ncbi:hypothetical protein HDK77DRAFT_426174 [Phyllosticta capitalensis]